MSKKIEDSVLHQAFAGAVMWSIGVVVAFLAVGPVGAIAAVLISWSCIAITDSLARQRLMDAAKSIGEAQP